MGGRVGTCPVRGPLAPWAAGFEAWLVARGFSSRTVGRRMCLLAVLSRWLEREGLTAGDLSEERAEMAVAARRGLGYVTWVSPRCVALPLAYLREVGAVPPPVVVVVEGPLAGLLEDYREYLVCERGLALSTIASYERGARLFLEQQPDGLELDRLTAADVSGFLARECRRLSVAGARHLVADLPRTTPSRLRIELDRTISRDARPAARDVLGLEPRPMRFVNSSAADSNATGASAAPRRTPAA
jgi:integrase/recombinase XerD